MRIAQVSPLFESVPPQQYGGTERVVSYLTEALVRLRHTVTLFASADSQTRAKLVPICPRSLRLDSACSDPIAWHALLVEKLFEDHNRFDIIHSHIDYLPLSMARRHPSASFVTTLHGRLDLPELLAVYREFPEMPFISISDAQRRPLPWANWQGTVYHGLPKHKYTPRFGAGGYLAFVGRISPEKGVEMAVDIAIAADMPLKIAAKVSAHERGFFNYVSRRFNHPLIEFIGELGEKDKNAFIGNAAALVFPIKWPEPFGLVMIEALACGTPVIARRCGSVPEIIADGITGFVFDDVGQAVEAVRNISSLSRRRCRQVFEERFTDERMAEDYLTIYANLIDHSEGELWGRQIHEKRDQY